MPNYNSKESLPKKKFIRSIYYDIYQVFHGSGVPIRLVLAMAALERAWGGKLVEEMNSYRLFNIKASKDHKGKTASMEECLEYDENGKPFYEKDCLFREYESYKESAEDLRKFFDDDKKYKVKNDDDKWVVFYTTKEFFDSIEKIAKLLQKNVFATGIWEAIEKNGVLMRSII